MAKEYVYLQGKVKWCRPHLPNKYNKWATNLYLTPDSLTKVKELKAKGLKNVLMRDEDGDYIVVSRPTSKVYRDKVQGFAPPIVLDGSTTLPDGSHPPLNDTPIGNGSDATIKVEVYYYNHDGNKGCAARWDTICVDNLVPFAGRSEFNPDEEKQTRGIEDVPQQPKW